MKFVAALLCLANLSAVQAVVSFGAPLPWLEDFSELPEGAMLDEGDTWWEITSTTGKFEVVTNSAGDKVLEMYG
jgi:hypothetical protein